MFSPVLPCATVLQLATGISAPNLEEHGVSVPDTAPLTKYGLAWNLSTPVLMHMQAPVCKALLKEIWCTQSGVKAPSILGWRIPTGCAETKTPRTRSPTTDRQQAVPEPVCQTTPSSQEKSFPRKNSWKIRKSTVVASLLYVSPCEMARPDAKHKAVVEGYECNTQHTRDLNTQHGTAGQDWTTGGHLIPGQDKLYQHRSW